MLILFIAVLSLGCENTDRIEGLWTVRTVMVGDNNITPNGRWMRFNLDGSQISGNGWQQHSIGTWDLDKEKSELAVFNDNGLEDPYGPFDIVLEKESMQWTRQEDGQDVIVKLEKIDVIPIALRDEIVGLWQVVESAGNDNYFSVPQDTIDYLFFRWDRKFVMSGDDGRLMGVYNVHAHKPEVELFPYNEELSRSTWKVLQDGNSLRLEKLDTNGTVYRSFRRVKEFPKR